MKTLEATLTGTQKVALILLQLENAAEVMSQFTDAEAVDIAAEIVRMRKVSADVSDGVISEFHDLVQNGAPASRGGHDAAANLLEASFGSERAAGVMGKLASSMAGKSFEFLESAEAGQIAALVEGEIPEVIALVLAHLKPQQASAVIAGFDGQLKADVAQSIATLGSANPEVVSIIADILKLQAGAVVSAKETIEVAGGVQPLVEIINRADIGTERQILEELDKRDPELAEEVRARMLTFEDIVKLERREVQTVLRGIDVSVLALAMKGASTTVIEVIETNVSARNLEVLRAEMAALGPVRSSQIEEARSAIVRAIREMEADGKIVVRRTEDDDLVV